MRAEAIGKRVVNEAPLRELHRHFLSELLQHANGMFVRGRATVHGFRAMASTALNEMGFRPDVIERQLAHEEKNAVRAAYNRTEYMQ